MAMLFVTTMAGALDELSEPIALLSVPSDTCDTILTDSSRNLPHSTRAVSSGFLAAESLSLSSCLTLVSPDEIWSLRLSA